MSEVHRELEVERAPNVSVRVPAGRVHIIEGDNGRVAIGVRGRQADRFEIEHHGSRVSIRPGSGRRVSASHDVDVTCPLGSELQINTASSDVNVEGEFADATIVTASGDVAVDSVAGELSVKTASGSVTTTNTAGRARIRTMSGGVMVGAAQSDLSVKTASGDMELEGAQGELIAKSTSGDVFAKSFGGPSFNAKTVSGGVRLEVVPGRTASLSLDSLTGTITLPEESGASSGVGTALQITIKTVTGDIAIQKT